MRRQRLLGLVLLAVVLSAVGGWLVGSQIQSPAEVALRTAPPPASPILVPAEYRVLQTDIVTRGTGRFGQPQRLTLAPSALKPLAGVITDVPLPGASLQEGDVILTASGRPVFLLRGDQPAFRDLGPGTEGADVRQLEEALVRLGYDPGPSDGLYDERTAEAVAAWYRAEGFAPFESTEEQLAAIRAMEIDLVNAELDVLGAQDAVAAAEAALAGALITAASETATAEADLATALANAGLARLAGGQSVADAQAAVLAAPGAVAAAQAEAETANAVAAANVASRQATLDGLLAGTRAMPASPAEIASAEAELATAIADHEATRVAGEGGVAAARAALDAAPFALAQAEAQAQAALIVADAELAVQRGRLLLLAAEGRPNTPALQREATAIRVEIAHAEANRDAIRLAGDQAIAAARTELDRAGTALAAAETEAIAVSRSAVAQITAKEAALDLLRGVRPAVAAGPAEIAAAEAELTAALAAAEQTRVAGEHAVATARAGLDAANANVQQAEVLAAASTYVTLPEIAARQTALDAILGLGGSGAESGLVSLGIDSGVVAAESTLSNAITTLSAREQLAKLIEAELDRLRTRAGIQVPADEVVFVAETPLRVSTVAVVRGDEARGGVMTVTDSVILIDGGLQLGEASLVEPGMLVQIDEPELGIEASGVVRWVAESPGTNGVDGFHVYFEIVVEETAPLVVGASVRLTIPIQTTGEAALTVPLSALTLAPDGSSRVQREIDGGLQFVTVRPGLSADGFVEVTPVDGELRADDRVVIGFEPRGSAAGG